MAVVLGILGAVLVGAVLFIVTGWLLAWMVAALVAIAVVGVCHYLIWGRGTPAGLVRRGDAEDWPS
jgi:hypothetical protein